MLVAIEVTDREIQSKRGRSREMVKGNAENGSRREEEERNKREDLEVGVSRRERK